MWTCGLAYEHSAQRHCVPCGPREGDQTFPLHCCTRTCASSHLQGHEHSKWLSMCRGTACQSSAIPPAPTALSGVGISFVLSSKVFSAARPCPCRWVVASIVSASSTKLPADSLHVGEQCHASIVVLLQDHAYLLAAIGSQLVSIATGHQRPRQGERRQSRSQHGPSQKANPIHIWTCG